MRQPLRILHCLRAPVGGLFRHVSDLAREQARRGHKVAVICDTRTADGLTNRRLEDLAGHLELGLVRVPMPREPGLGDLVGCRETFRQAKRLGVDVIHGHGAKGGAYARIASTLLKRVPLSPVSLYTPHGGSLHYGDSSLKGRMLMGAERFLCRMTDCIVFESNYSSQVFARQVGEVDCVRKVIPNGVGSDEFSMHVPSETAAHLLFIGELRMLKGVDVLLQAMAQLRASGRDVTANIVGDGPDAATFHDLARNLGLAEQVFFLGAMPAREAFPLGRMLVMPSRAESFPYIILEAAAAAIPLVATEVGGIPEITAETPCRLVAPDDSTALSNAIAAALDTPQDAKAIALTLQARVRERFSVDAMTSSVLELYETLLSRHLAPSAVARIAPVAQA